MDGASVARVSSDTRKRWDAQRSEGRPGSTGSGDDQLGIALESGNPRLEVPCGIGESALLDARDAA
jgi:hypothetical protein